MEAGNKTEQGIVRLGRILGAHGIRGWVKVRSDTEPPEAVLRYQPWLVGENLRTLVVREASESGGGLRVALEGVTDRTAAEALSGMDIAVLRGQLPEPPENQYYWTDLIGCVVTTVEGALLGEVTEMIETGANDVMRIDGDRERLVPFVPGRYVRHVDLDNRRIEVAWDPEF